MGVDNPTRGTMCCAPLKLVPWVKRTRGPSDGDTLIRDSQVFYHSVRLKQISFQAAFREACMISFLFVFLMLEEVLHWFTPTRTCAPEDDALTAKLAFVFSANTCRVSSAKLALSGAVRFCLSG